jgi:RimJ/RimL family protein N-acetyltransferase
MKVEPVVLENAFVRLEPVEEPHREGLRGAAKGDTPLFDYMPMDLSGDDFDGWFDWSKGASDGRHERVFTVVRKPDNRIVGSTRYLNIDGANKRLEIGHTWYARDTWSSAVNPSCKFLLFAHAFEALKWNRVELKCDARNNRSRAAILKLGAKEEGTLRQHMILRDGYVRDTIYFSVVAAEWPGVRGALHNRIACFPH